MNFFERLKYLVLGGSVKTKGMNFVADGYSDVSASNHASKENGFSFAHASKPKFNFVADSYKSDERFLRERADLIHRHKNDKEFSRTEWSAGLMDEFDRAWYGYHDDI